MTNTTVDQFKTEILKGEDLFLKNRMRNIMCEIKRFGLNKMGASEKELRDHMYDSDSKRI
ncbi:MAG: hypothetical protein JW896_11685 [Deltaproteobacteria bacterium]|nr:hypothetical protein [Deltaproteobacteria bacterium]